MDKDSQEGLTRSEQMARQNARTGLMVVGVVVAMIALSFASVPLYDAFCRVTGWGGTTQRAEVFPAPDAIIDREITIRFDANVAENLPWDFRPETFKSSVKLGERGFVNYISVNRSTQPVGGTALFNVTPLKAGKYFHKVQCFCFDEQILEPKQRVNMPVLFYVDPAMHDDPNMDDVSTITLSYSFFKAESKALDEALEAYYEGDTIR